MKKIQKKVKDLKRGDKLEYGKFDDFVCSITEENPEIFQIVDFCFENGNKVDEDCNNLFFELEYFTLTSEYQLQVPKNTMDCEFINIEDFVVNVFVD